MIFASVSLSLNFYKAGHLLKHRQPWHPCVRPTLPGEWACVELGTKQPVNNQTTRLLHDGVLNWPDLAWLVPQFRSIENRSKSSHSEHSVKMAATTLPVWLLLLLKVWNERLCSAEKSTVEVQKWTCKCFNPLNAATRCGAEKTKQTISAWLGGRVARGKQILFHWHQ